jgi:hypothetical protein
MPLLPPCSRKERAATERIFSWFRALCSREYRTGLEYARTLMFVKARIDPAKTARALLPAFQLVDIVRPFSMRELLPRRAKPEYLIVDFRPTHSLTAGYVLLSGSLPENADAAGRNFAPRQIPNPPSNGNRRKIPNLHPQSFGSMGARHPSRCIHKSIHEYMQWPNRAAKRRLWKPNFPLLWPESQAPARKPRHPSLIYTDQDRNVYKRPNLRRKRIS